MCPHQAKSVWPPEELVRTGTERSFPMKVELEPQYTVTGTSRNLRKTVILTILAGLCVAASGVIATLGPEKGWKGGTVACLMLLSLGFMTAGFCDAWEVAMAGAHRMAGMHQLAERQKIRADLLTEFRPTEEQVDRKLGILAHRFNLACKDVAQFHQDHPHRIGDMAEGTVLTVDQKLEGEILVLEENVKNTKADFWDLYGAIKTEGYDMRPTWGSYLTHAGVGPNDPEVLAGRKA